jgi:hypothetical protein
MLNLGLDISGLFGGRDHGLEAQLRQAHIDNVFRGRQANLAESWRIREWNDRGNRIQRLAQDAKKAGVSTLAALGAGGSAPANITVPAGQGGRVSGVSQKRSPSLSLNTNLLNQFTEKAELETDITRIKRDKAELDLWSHPFYEGGTVVLNNGEAISHGEYLRRKHQIPIENMFEARRWNIEDAKKWHDDPELVPMLKGSSLEMPESIGGAYWVAPRMKQTDNPYIP